MGEGCSCFASWFVFGRKMESASPVCLDSGQVARNLLGLPALAVRARERHVATVGGARRDRTADLVNAIHALSQLSYGPEPSLPTSSEHLKSHFPRHLKRKSQSEMPENGHVFQQMAFERRKVRRSV
jgi:hypothetical protein